MASIGPNPSKIVLVLLLGGIGSSPMIFPALLPGSEASPEAAQRQEGSNNLKRIGITMHNFHDIFRAFPAGYSADAEGNPLLSWRVHVLPLLDEQALYKEFHLDEPWDSPHNKKLIPRMPQVYRGPASKAKPGLTNYLGIAGKAGIFVRPQNGNRLGISFRNVLDGTSNTIMAVEVPDESAVVWTQPGDFAPDLVEPTKGLTGMHPGGFQAGFADGSVRFIPESIAPDTLRAYFTKDGGERVP